MAEKKNYLTREGLKKYEDELHELKSVRRLEISQKIKEAREQGDLSENFEYYAAKQAKNQNESRIRYLENMIRTAEIIEDNSRADEVGLNKRVVVDFGDGDTEEYKIVTPVRANSLEGRITFESPLGAALMGRKAGDVCTVRNGDASYTVKILSVENTGEEETDVIRRY